jgi:hypothetical protein
MISGIWVIAAGSVVRTSLMITIGPIPVCVRRRALAGSERTWCSG